MGVDLATTLAAMSTAWVGNPLSISPGFSIGRPTESSKNLLNDLFGLTSRSNVSREMIGAKQKVSGRDAARAYRIP